MTLEFEPAVPFAMLLYELFSNACKHAFPPRQAAAIRMGIHQNGSWIELSIEDTGYRLPSGFDGQQTSSLDVMLQVHGIFEQLRGTIELRSESEAIARVLPSRESEPRYPILAMTWWASRAQARKHFGGVLRSGN